MEECFISYLFLLSFLLFLLNYSHFHHLLSIILLCSIVVYIIFVNFSFILYYFIFIYYNILNSFFFYLIGISLPSLVGIAIRGDTVIIQENSETSASLSEHVFYITLKVSLTFYSTISRIFHLQISDFLLFFSFFLCSIFNLLSFYISFELS